MQTFTLLICDYFLIHKSKHVLWALIRTNQDVSLEHPQHMLWLRNKKTDSQSCTLTSLHVSGGLSIKRVVFWYDKKNLHCLIHL